MKAMLLAERLIAAASVYAGPPIRYNA
jgi:hypothetical protein